MIDSPNFVTSLRRFNVSSIFGKRQRLSLSFTVHKSKRKFMDALQSRLITLSTFTLYGSRRTNFYIFPDVSLIRRTTYFPLLDTLSLRIPTRIWRQTRRLIFRETARRKYEANFYLDTRCIRNRSTRITVVTDGV